ncbi:hypothetical protein A2872_02205 [Candidatus Gottesmanbacteria bacterium RIFCSPHIGHO2_01_FULL_42_12]|uniref:Nucleotidyl transferase AbiEii/AbiGii toxin family protein n=1 Tax=Candidatus Gottesmanbacteria bacterium RIFCSPHIGHO2_01_FULL_42_12 TaxID=1798377 RepID=A0A1F5Z5T2_9BACT|nr:MAG: hypothetical protein A2872_02205 [Candidatus Gottesmanbacteria bacterium RIFCSPHIGHO2_01_FULL_42_12]
MLGFYNDLVTQKSFLTLQNLRGKLGFILIGGWAVYLYTKALKSKDIDIIINFDQLEKLKQDFEIIKNDRLKKYEARKEEVQIDIYLPYYSNIRIPVEKITDFTKIETFTVPSVEMLLILKQLAYEERGLSPKGQKDKLDILSLLYFGNFDTVKYQKLVKKLNLRLNVGKIIQETIKIPELGVNEYQWSKWKRNFLSGQPEQRVI